MKITNKTELCNLINDMIAEFKEQGIAVTLQDLIKDAVSLEEATKNTLYAYSYLLMRTPARTEYQLRYKFDSYIHDNLDVQAIYDSCWAINDTDTNIVIGQYRSMNKIELQLEINKIEQAIDDYFVLRCVRSMPLWITYFRTLRELLEQYITDGKFLVRDERLKAMSKEMNKEFKACQNSVPAHVKNLSARYGQIARTIITAVDKATGQSKEFKTEENELMNYDELCSLAEGHEIVSIEWCSISYVINNLEYPILTQYHEEVKKLRK